MTVCRTQSQSVRARVGDTARFWNGHDRAHTVPTPLTATARSTPPGIATLPCHYRYYFFFFYHGPSHRHVLWNVNKTQTSPRHNSLCGCCCLLWCVSCMSVNWFFSFYWPVKLFGFGSSVLFLIFKYDYRDNCDRSLEFFGFQMFNRAFLNYTPLMFNCPPARRSVDLI